jgi:hypothetical protein
MQQRPSAFLPKPWAVRSLRWRGAINTDKHAAYDPPAFAGLQAAGYLARWNRTTARSSVGSTRVNIFRSFWDAWRTFAGYEAIHIIRKGQASGSASAPMVGLLHRFVPATS